LIWSPFTGFWARVGSSGEDAFVLRREQVRKALAQPSGARLQRLAAERVALRETARATRPEPFLGPPPDREAEPASIAAKSYAVPARASRANPSTRGSSAVPIGIALSSVGLKTSSGCHRAVCSSGPQRNSVAAGLIDRGTRHRH
jgi:hypothetical protein